MIWVAAVLGALGAAFILACLMILLGFGCAVGAHDWRDGPGAPCRDCGVPDDAWEKPRPPIKRVDQ